jgi:hypothetical protein
MASHPIAGAVPAAGHLFRAGRGRPRDMAVGDHGQGVQWAQRRVAAHQCAHPHARKMGVNKFKIN